MNPKLQLGYLQKAEQFKLTKEEGGKTMNRIGPLGGILKAGNAGIVTVTAGNDLCHTMPTRAIAGPRTARIYKIMCYNVSGANRTLQFGTLNRNPAGAAFEALLPIFVAINGLDNEWGEEDIPFVEWRSDETLTAAGRTGDIHVLCDAVGAAAATVQITVEEFGS